jgi:hypothetical protein
VIRSSHGSWHSKIDHAAVWAPFLLSLVLWPRAQGLFFITNLHCGIMKRALLCEIVQMSMRFASPSFVMRGPCGRIPRGAVELRLIGRHYRVVRGEPRRGWSKGTSGEQGGSWRKTGASTSRHRAPSACAKRGCWHAHNQARALPEGKEDSQTHASRCFNHRQGGGGCTPRCARDTCTLL